MKRQRKSSRLTWISEHLVTGGSNQKPRTDAGAVLIQVSSVNTLWRTTTTMSYSIGTKQFNEESLLCLILGTTI